MKDRFIRLWKSGKATINSQSDRVLERSCAGRIVSALTFIVVGAVMYIVSAGNTGMIEMAKGAMKNAAIGIIIVFVAWVFINYVTMAVGATPDLAAGWWKFKCN